MKSIEHEQGKTIHRQTGKTFYVATRLFPPRIREQTYVLYGFFRIADEVVDGDFGLSPAEQRRRLESIRDAAFGRRDAQEPVIRAFARLREREGISDREVNAFIDAMVRDIGTSEYETYDELSTYVRGSAAAVGNMMTAIMGVDEQVARPHAMALGEAFQLTNFLRDVSEDVTDLDRVYLPVETLERHGASIADVRARRCTPGVRKAVEAELHRAERRYRTGVAGIEYLPRDCQFSVLLAAVLYAEHHRLIRNCGFDVVSNRPTLSRTRTLWLTARTWWHWKRLGDPVGVFARVSAVPMDQPETFERTTDLDRPVTPND